MDQILFLGWALIKKPWKPEISAPTWMSEVTSLLPGGRDLMNFLMKAIRTKTTTVNPTEMATSKTSSFMFGKESPKTWCWEWRQTVNVNLGGQRRSDWSAPVEVEKCCCVLGANSASGILYTSIRNMVWDKKMHHGGFFFILTHSWNHYYWLKTRVSIPNLQIIFFFEELIGVYFSLKMIIMMTMTMTIGYCLN